MIKQRLKDREMAFQWVEGTLMAADVLTKGRERGHVDLLLKVLAERRYQIRPTAEMLEKRRQQRAAKAEQKATANRQQSSGGVWAHEETTGAGDSRSFACSRASDSIS